MAHTHRHTHTTRWRCCDFVCFFSPTGAPTLFLLGLPLDAVPSLATPSATACIVCEESGEGGGGRLGSEKSRQPHFHDLGKRPSS